MTMTQVVRLCVAILMSTALFGCSDKKKKDPEPSPTPKPTSKDGGPSPTPNGEQKENCDNLGWTGNTVQATKDCCKKAGEWFATKNAGKLTTAQQACDDGTKKLLGEGTCTVDNVAAVQTLEKVGNMCCEKAKEWKKITDPAKKTKAKTAASSACTITGHDNNVKVKDAVNAEDCDDLGWTGNTVQATTDCCTKARTWFTTKTSDNLTPAQEACDDVTDTLLGEGTCTVNNVASVTNLANVGNACCEKAKEWEKITDTDTDKKNEAKDAALNACTITDHAKNDIVKAAVTAR